MCAEKEIGSMLFMYILCEENHLARVMMKASFIISECQQNYRKCNISEQGLGYVITAGIIRGSSEPKSPNLY